MTAQRALSLAALLAVSLVAPAADSVRAEVGADGVQRAAILGGGYFFEPDHIVVKVNVPVELTVKREWGIVPHTLVLNVPEWNVAVDESLGTDAKVVRFTPTTTGTFKFYCRNRLLFFKSHEDKGMKGVIEVIP